MPHLELEFSPHEDRPFQSSIEYQDPNNTPVKVARKADAILDKFYGGQITNADRSWLLNQALSLVYMARKGFLNNMDLLRNLGRITPDTLDELLRYNKPYSEDSPGDEETETFSRVYIAFGALTDFVTHPLLPRGFSKRGMLEFPFTTEELYGRIEEMGEEIVNVGTRKISRRVDPLARPSLLRTHLTFYTMGNMDPLIEDGTVGGIGVGALEGIAQKFQNPLDR